VDKQIALVLSFFPLLAFVIAAVTELRFCTTNLVTIRNLIPSTLGIAAFRCYGIRTQYRRGWRPVSFLIA
jgi:hypothetical protein